MDLKPDTGYDILTDNLEHELEHCPGQNLPAAPYSTHIMPMKITIRPATADDIEAMLTVLESANMHYIPSEEMPELDWRCCFVAESNNRIIGMSGYKILSPTEAKTTLMAVLPDCRGSGAGMALQTRRMETLLDHGITYLTTNADRPATIAWYKKHFGYQQIGTLAKVHEFGHPDIDSWTTMQTNLKAWKESISFPASK